MDPLITNGADPALLRVIEKRGDSHDLGRRRGRRSPAKEQAPGPEIGDGKDEGGSQENPPSHRIDDLA